ncbi:hypothetical protein P3S68_029812 [Capsicum galapagoense]
MLAHLLHHFVWSLPNGVEVEDVDMMESPGTVTYMRTPITHRFCPKMSRLHRLSTQIANKNETDHIGTILNLPGMPRSILGPQYARIPGPPSKLRAIAH